MYDTNFGNVMKDKLIDSYSFPPFIVRHFQQTHTSIVCRIAGLAVLLILIIGHIHYLFCASSVLDVVQEEESILDSRRNLDAEVGNLYSFLSRHNCNLLAKLNNIFINTLVQPENFRLRLKVFGNVYNYATFL